MGVGLERKRPMERTNRPAMTSLGLTPEQMKRRRRLQAKRNYQRNRRSILQYWRDWRRGIHRAWLDRAVAKASGFDPVRHCEMQKEVATLIATVMARTRKARK